MNARNSLAYLWRRTLHNLPQKLAALLVAMGVWFIATADRRATVEGSFVTPLRVIDQNAQGPEGTRRTVGGIVRTVRVTLSGPRTQIANLSGDEIEASTDVTTEPEGSFQSRITVRPPEGTRVVRYSPTVASGFIDTEITRTLPVRLSLTDLPERALPRYEVSPRAVQVIGPEQIVESVTSVVTVPVALARGASAEARLLALDENGRPVTEIRVAPATVTVERTDRADLPIKTVPVDLPEPPADLEIVSAELDPPSVRVLGDTATLARINAVPARVPIREGRYTARATLVLPAGARSLDVVTVTLDVRQRGANP